MPTFTRADLAIRDELLAALETSLASAANPAPVDTEIERQVARVTRYLSGKDVEDADWKQFVRRLVLYELRLAAGDIGEPETAAYKATLEELSAIRDGKFERGLATAPTAGADWGSKTNILAE